MRSVSNATKMHCSSDCPLRKMVNEVAREEEDEAEIYCEAKCAKDHYIEELDEG